jgi:hypothetical protein
MGKIDALSLIFTDFYVPLLTLQLHTEAALLLWEHNLPCDLLHRDKCHQQRRLGRPLEFKTEL